MIDNWFELATNHHDHCVIIVPSLLHAQTENLNEKTILTTIFPSISLLTGVNAFPSISENKEKFNSKLTLKYLRSGWG